MEGAKILRRVPCGIVCSRREAVLKQSLMELSGFFTASVAGTAVNNTELPLRNR